ncbi:MAG: MFS transporter [Gemmataceae bacterium]|nr:MFS transporter [Gemmataceae bacterium]
MTANGSTTAALAVQDGPQTPLPGARSALILLLTINLFNFIDRQILAAVLPKVSVTLFESDTGHDTELGALTTAFMISFMLTSPLFGWLADRMPRWRLVGIGVILWSLACGASGLAPQVALATGIATPFVLMFITRCFLGIGEAAYTPVAPAMLSDLYPARQRGQVMAWFYAAIPVGGALGYVFGGVVTDLTGDWRWAFYLVVPPGLGLGIWCFLMPEPRVGAADLRLNGTPPASQETGIREGEPPLTPSPVPPRRASWADYLILFKTPSWVINTAGYTALTFAIGGIAVWMPKYVYTFRRAADSLGQANIIFGLIVVVSGLGGTLAGGWAGDRLRGRVKGAYFLVSGISMLLAFPFLLLTLYMPFPLAWVFVFLTCFFLFFNTGPINTILANVTHPSIRATGFALNVLIIHALGDVISPPIMGAINDANNGDMNPSFLVVSFLIVVGAGFWLWGTRYLDRDTALAPTRLGS